MTKQELAKAIVWMMDKGYATGHGDTVVDLLQELEWQVAEREREACAKVAESYEPTCDSCPSGAAIAIRSRGIDGAKVGEVGVWGEKEANRSQATTSAGKPNYCTPQVTPEVTPEVTGEANETAKVKYMDMSRFPAEIPNWKPGMVVPNPKREWVGIEPQEIGQIWAKHKEVYGFGIELEQVLKERNT
jgi:hypothetical protein